jgi:septation ring formation regulator EzrA
LEAVAAKLAGELAEYKAESKELRNQEHTIRKLEDRVRSLDSQLEEKVRVLAEDFPGVPAHFLLISNNTRGLMSAAVRAIARNVIQYMRGHCLGFGAIFPVHAILATFLMYCTCIDT